MMKQARLIGVLYLEDSLAPLCCQMLPLRSSYSDQNYMRPRTNRWSVVSAPAREQYALCHDAAFFEAEIAAPAFGRRTHDNVIEQIKLEDFASLIDPAR